MTAPILHAEGIEKRYGRVVALGGADLAIHAGECVGLIGDNGAGKSTLVKILSGAVTPDAGALHLNGEPVSFATPADARAAGIETVYQDLALATSLGAASNIFLGRELLRPGLLGKLGFVDRGAMQARTRELLKGLNSRIQSLDTPVGHYSGGQRQAVAIARAITWEQRVLILDEPTAALGVPQRKMVLELLDRLRAEHPTLGIVLISHDLPNVFRATDRIVVMRHGQTVAHYATGEATEHELLAAMTGIAA